MTQNVTTPPSTSTGYPGHPDRSRLPRQLTIFVIVALGVGWPLLTLSTRLQPDAPFILAAVLLGLALPALILTHRQAGRAGIHALLRNCVRSPTRWWWLLLAAFTLPVLTWSVGAALGGAQPLTWRLLAFYTADLIIGALIINIWEEMGWTGYFQRRAAARWGPIGGLITAVSSPASTSPSPSAAPTAPAR